MSPEFGGPWKGTVGARVGIKECDSAVRSLNVYFPLMRNKTGSVGDMDHSLENL